MTEIYKIHKGKASITLHKLQNEFQNRPKRCKVWQCKGQTSWSCFVQIWAIYKNSHEL